MANQGSGKTGRPSNATLEFCAAFALYHRELFGKALRITCSRMDAEDLMQETAERAWLGWEKLVHKEHSRAWLYRILHNVFVDHCRRKGRERMLNQRWHQARMSEAHAPSSVERSNGHETWSDEVDVALQRLSAPARDVVMRVALDEDSYDCVARDLDCPMGTVMSRLYRARQQLQQDLEPYALKEGYIAAA